MEKITNLPKKLQFWNPLDVGRLLVWVLWFPDRLKTHREMYGETAEKYLAGWLISTLVWLPLFLMTFAIGLELIPLTSMKIYTKERSFIWIANPIEYFEYSKLILVAWFITGILGFRTARFWFFIVITIEIIFLSTFIDAKGVLPAIFFTTIIIGGFPISFSIASSAGSFMVKKLNKIISFILELIIFFITLFSVWLIILVILPAILYSYSKYIVSLIDVANKSINAYIIICLAINMLSVVIVVNSFSINNLNKSLETGRISYVNRFLLMLLIISYTFVIWTYHLNGWLYFQ